MAGEADTELTLSAPACQLGKPALVHGSLEKSGLPRQQEHNRKPEINSLILPVIEIDLSSTISSSTSSKLSEVTPPQPPPALQIAPPSINKMLNVSFSGSDTESMAALSIADSTSKEVKRRHHHHNLPHHHLSSTSLEQQNPPFRTRINSSFR